MKHLQHILYISCLCALILMSLTGCGSTDSKSETAPEPVSRDFFAMDTYMTVTAYGDNAEKATEEAEAEVTRLEDMLSSSKKNSEISRLNSEGSGILSKEAADLVKKSLQIHDETDGAFDIAILPIVDAWGFRDDDHRVPSDEEIDELLKITDADDMTCTDAGDGKAKVEFDLDSMAIDLGAIAKGYASSRIIDIFKENGITSGLVNLGGNVQTLGKKPDGSRWNIAIQDPNRALMKEDEIDESTPEYMGVLEAEDTAVITSGPYERNFTKDGKLYHHIIDPSTGRPAENGLRSVTIISDDGTLADALATSLYVMGREKATEFWREHSDEFNFIIMDSDDELYVTKPVADDFSSNDYDITIVE